MPMKIRPVFVLCALPLLAAGRLSAAVEDWLPREPSAEAWQPLSLDAIRLGGVFRERIDRTVEGGILQIDADKTFLEPFVKKNRTDGSYVAVGKFTESCVLLASFDSPIPTRP